MRILITGGAGMIGRKLTARLLADGNLKGKPITELHLHDVVDAAILGVVSHSGDLASAGVAEKLAALKPDVIFHLAGVVSGEAEAKFELGYRVNLDGTRQLFEAIRAAKISPRVVFTSSIAVFGAPFPDFIPDRKKGITKTVKF
ncbi:MAG: NAD-dependent epimerase/dehydratase family protein, partial [Aestuariivirga sp.]